MGKLYCNFPFVFYNFHKWTRNRTESITKIIEEVSIQKAMSLKLFLVKQILTSSFVVLCIFFPCQIKISKQTSKEQLLFNYSLQANKVNHISFTLSCLSIFFYLQFPFYANLSQFFFFTNQTSPDFHSFLHIISVELSKYQLEICF